MGTISILALTIEVEVRVERIQMLVFPMARNGFRIYTRELESQVFVRMPPGIEFSWKSSFGKGIRRSSTLGLKLYNRPPLSLGCRRWLAEFLALSM